eukprot:gene8674-17907_t
MQNKSKSTRQRKQKKQKSSCTIQYLAALIIAPIFIYFFQSFLRGRIETSEFSNGAFKIQNKVDEIYVQQKNYTNETPLLRKVNEMTLIRKNKNKNLRKEPIKKSTSNRQKIAYAITITKDGFFQDGAAVLAYSVIAASKGKDYDITFIAFVHPNVTIARPFLSRLGYNVIEAPTPLNTSAIRGNKFLREKIDKNGCCGATELIKLYAYRLTDFDRIVHMDADTMLINPIDELFAMNRSLIYTTDPNMATFKGELGLPGGFLVLKPSIQDYLNIVNIVMTVPFRNGGGWNNSHVGWYWGGMTIQGVLAYYYYLVTTPGRSLKVDRCIYNTMADTIPCSNQTLDEIKSAHFTVCQKPWNCEYWQGDWHEPLCKKLHERWFKIRKEAEFFYGIKSPENGCTGYGKRHYIPMDLEHATIPPSVYSSSDSSSGSSGGVLLKYNAPVRLDPLPGAGFTAIDNNNNQLRQ